MPAPTWAGRRTISSQGEASHSRIDAESELQIDATGLNIGEVWETDNFVWTVPVRNRGSRPIRVASFKSSCSCVAASSPTPIGPDETVDVKLQIDLRNRCAMAPLQAVRDVEFKVYLGSDSVPAGRLTPIELRGLVRSAVAISARSVDLGRLPAATAPKVRDIAVRALLGLRDLKATSESASVRAEVKPTGTGTWVLRVSAVPNLSPGKYRSTVRLQPFLSSGDTVPSVGIPVEFDVLGDVQPDSAVMLLGTHTVGSTVEGRITLYSLSGRPFTVHRWCAEPPGGVEVSPIDSITSASTFMIRQQVGAPGDQLVRIHFGGRDAQGQAFESFVDVYRYGLDR